MRPVVEFILTGMILPISDSGLWKTTMMSPAVLAVSWVVGGFGSVVLVLFLSATGLIDSTRTSRVLPM